NAASDQYDALGRYGLKLGLAFQIVDDLLDVTSATATLGKRAGKDEAEGKQTYPRVFGVAESMRRARQEVAEAKDAARVVGEPADPLVELAAFIVERQSSPRHDVG